MTTRTIETEKTVTDEQEVEICDGCGEGEDKSELMEYYPSHRKSDEEDWDSLHFHRGCKSQLDTSAPERYKGLWDDSSVKDSYNKLKDVLTGYGYAGYTSRIVFGVFYLIYFPYFFLPSIIYGEVNDMESSGESITGDYILFLGIWMFIFSVVDIFAEWGIMWDATSESAHPTVWVNAFIQHFPVISWLPF